ncbi:MAG: anion permease [Chloroflexi bacterium]|nr:anion permease [Chloroflexota bacterium]
MSAFHPLLTSNSSFMPGADMRLAALMVGVAAVLMGLLWIGQGAGLIDWPASSFMIDQRPWITRGAILTVAGLVLIAISQVRNRKPL